MKTAIVATLLSTVALVSALPSQERVLTKVQRPYLDARLSPDGKWVAYQANGILYTLASSGAGSELRAYKPTNPKAGAVTYFWESNSASLVVYADARLIRVSRDGTTVRLIADLKNRNVRDFYTTDGVWVFGVRNVQNKTIITRIRINDGKSEDIVSTVPGVSDLDIDSGRKRLLITATVFLFQYQFFACDLDGKNLLALNSKALTSVTNRGRWLEGTKTLVFENNGQVGSRGAGQQLWVMQSASGNARPMTWSERIAPLRWRGHPAVSGDGKWVAAIEFEPGKSTQRAALVPAEGGGIMVLSPTLTKGDGRVQISNDGSSLVYVGTTDPKQEAVVRRYDVDRPARLTPTMRPGTTGQVELPLGSKELGVLFLGFGEASKPLKLPGLTGEFGLDLSKGMLMLYAGAASNLKGPFVIPNDNKLLGLTIFVQPMRLLTGQFKGSFPPMLHIDITP